jgi:hypothetical protein
MTDEQTNGTQPWGSGVTLKRISRGDVTWTLSLAVGDQTAAAGLSATVDRLIAEHERLDEHFVQEQEESETR